ncbi:MAG: hypothetical protein K0S65_4237, partial [Labilithrix sp.]|nr:hypothetical protein [Labilithrix sp.]
SCPKDRQISNMMFLGIIGFVTATLLVTALLLKGNGDSPANYF